jgi:hypothetical protein
LRREARVLVQRAAPEPVAPEDNAAPVYRRALAAIQPLSWSWGYDEVPELSATQRAALDAELKANKPVFALLRKAAQRPRCDFHRNLTVLDLTQRERWELAYMRELGTLIRFRVELALFRGRIDAAIADWKLLHRLHEHLAEDCFQIGRLTGLALNQMSLEVWQTILLQEGLTARQAAAIDPGSSVDFVAMIVESLDVEEARVLSAIADYIDGRYVQSASPIQYGMIHWYRTLLFGREVREFREATAGLREAYRGYDSDQPAPWPGPFPKYDFGPVTQASSDIDFSLFKSALFAAMHQRCAAVALEIRMRELQPADGVPMSAAPDLTAIELPVDVFATPPGRKIQWNRERRIVYSIGYDREDNGGNDGDIVVKY